MAIKNWSTTAANNNSAAPDGWPEGMPASDVNDAARQMMADIRSWYEDAQWVDYGDTPVYVSGTSFKVAGTDVTSRYTANRRIKVVGGSTVYGYVASSSFSTDTTVNVTLDSGTVPADVSAVSLGIITPTNTSLPQSSKFTKVAVSGQSDVEADSATDTITFAGGTGITLTTDAGTDTVTITNSQPSDVNFTSSLSSKLAGIAAGAEVNQNAFSNIAVSGQTTVASDAKTDTVTFAAGSGITITTNATTDTVTFTNSGAGEANQNAFSNVAVSGQTTVAADSTTDTLTFVAGTGMTITTNATSDSVTFTASTDASTLDGIDSTSFARSDQADTITATWTMRQIDPQTTATYDLGTSAAEWRRVYVDGGSASGVYMDNVRQGKRTVSTSAASGGQDGDVWYQVT